MGQGHETVNFGGQEVKDQGHAHEARFRFEVLAEASFSILLGRVSFPVVVYFQC